jgi:dihydrofolate reductase
MRIISSFNFVTLNGFFEGPNHDLSWHKHGGQEESEFALEGLRSDSILLYGRATYEMMASFWPTPMAAEMMPEMAAGMNKAEKIVFSRTLKKADWNNTTIISNNIFEEVRKLKQSPGRDMTILGSGSIVRQFAEEGLIDVIQLMVDPVALGNGTPLFKNMRRQLDLQLMDTRTFKSGVVLLSYRPV